MRRGDGTRTSATQSVLEGLAAALAANATVEQTKADTEWEPDDRREHTCTKTQPQYKLSPGTFLGNGNF